MEEKTKIYFWTAANFGKFNAPPPFSPPDNNEYSITLSGGKNSNFIRNEENNVIFSSTIKII